ncbi:MAG: septal ring lytic transglycosylase RlpA family protein [Bacteroidales bacterium]|nr:septal ring lytic transglycosylase RlpA family protein [Bacteroidales bacterium]
MIQNFKNITFSLIIILIFVACGNKQRVKSVNLGNGEASWYGPGFHGKITANGEKYNMNDLTAAHPWLQFGSIVKVINLDNNLAVNVRINDRGPYHKNRVIDLSKAAAKKIKLIKTGVAQVKIELVGYQPVNFKALLLHYKNLININKKLK